MGGESTSTQTLSVFESPPRTGRCPRILLLCTQPPGWKLDEDRYLRCRCCPHCISQSSRGLPRPCVLRQPYPFRAAASAMEATCSSRSRQQRAPWRDMKKMCAWPWRQQGRGPEAKTGSGPSSSSPRLHPHRDRSAVPAALLRHGSTTRVHLLWRRRRREK